MPEQTLSTQELRKLGPMLAASSVSVGPQAPASELCPCCLSTLLSEHRTRCWRAAGQGEEVEEQWPLRGARYSCRVRQEGPGCRERRGNSLHSQWIPEQRFRVDILIPVIPSSSSPSTYCLSSDFLPVPLAWPPPHPACCGHVAQRASSSPTVWGPGLSRGHLGNRNGWRTWS